MNITQLAKATGVDQSTVYRIVRGQTKKPSMEIIDKLETFINGQADRRKVEDRRGATKQDVEDLRYLLESYKEHNASLARELEAVRGERDSLKLENESLKKQIAAGMNPGPPRLQRKGKSND